MSRADEESWIFTGRLSFDTQEWLADHAVMGVVLLPGTAFIELALAAGQRTGAALIEELTFEAPLVVTDEGAVQIQVVVEAPDENSTRQVAIYSRPQGSSDSGDAPWTRHAIGVLAPASTTSSDGGEGPADASWPPDGAEPVDIEFLYDRLSEAGYDYGPAFQGLHAAWHRGEELFGEVALDDQQAREAEDFGAHPALFDAALHVALQAALSREEGKLIVPFSVRGVRLHRAGVSALRVRLTEGEGGALEIEARDLAGEKVLSVDALVARPIDAGVLQGSADSVHDSLYGIDWVQARSLEVGDRTVRCALIGEREVPGVEHRYTDLTALAGAVEEGAPAPDFVLIGVGGEGSEDLAAATHTAVKETLAILREWLAEKRLADARLVLVSRGAVRARHGEAPDPVAAAVLGLLRSAQSEHPGHFVLVDLDPSGDRELAWQSVLGHEEPQLAVRGDSVLVPRLDSVKSGGFLPLPAGEPEWQLTAGGEGTLDGLTLSPAPRPNEELQRGQVRIALHAAGLNFRDVLLALDTYAGQARMGGEGAGKITAVGAGVEDLTVGDRVMGAMTDAFGPVIVAESPGLAPLPEGWSFAQGASVPLAFLTAFFGLFDLAGLKRGERVLIHAGAGGVGMAAVQLATHAGAEVFATASPGKWQVLRELGIDDEHLASSRDLEFREKFLATTDGDGVDVVLNALAGDFVDASLDLLPRGGRFIEMGKADIRDAEAIATGHAGVVYRAFDLQEAGADRINEMLGELLDLFAAGKIQLEPIAVWDIRRGIDAFRHLRDGRNVGKIVLTIPQPLDPDGTVLITGGTGGLGALVARHLVTIHGARHLMLLSRSGPEAKGATELREELEAAGCEVEIVACDVADRAQLEAAIGAIAPEHPLNGVVHAAGVLDDGLIEALDPEQVDRVLSPKIDAALHLHELTRDHDLSRFVLFSSAAASLGNPGQGNYAAANAFLDALAQRRQAEGLAAQSLAWGLWLQDSGTGMGADLDEAALARLQRVGIVPLSDEKGLQLLDAAAEIDAATLVPVHLDLSSMRTLAQAGVLPPMLRQLVRAPVRRKRTGGRSLGRRLAALPESEWQEVVLESVRGEVAAVLGYDSAEAIDTQVAFKDLGFDSLAAVELYNRLCQATGLRLPTTLGFDYPTPEAVTEYICTKMASGKEEEGQRAEAESVPA